MDYRLLLGILAVIIGFVGYFPYFKNILKGKTKPHAFSWLVWGVLTGIAFFAQVTSRGGFGTWVTGFTAVICIIIFLLALKRGIRDFPLVDWLSLLGVGIALLLWAVTKGPLAAVILISLIDMLGFIPTIRKSYSKPYEETLFTYAFSSLKFIIGVIALREFSLVNVLYPISLIVTNGVFIIMIQIRRKQIPASR